MISSKLRSLVGILALAGTLAVPLLAATASPASADWQRRGGYYNGGGGGGHYHGGGYYRGGYYRSGGGCWNCGFIPGLAVGLGVAALAAAPYYYAPPPVYYAPPPAYYPAPGYYYAPYQ